MFELLAGRPVLPASLGGRCLEEFNVKAGHTVFSHGCARELGGWVTWTAVSLSIQRAAMLMPV